MKKHISLSLVIFLCISNLFAQKQKIIFDCDLGGDIDDAFALALLLCSQEEFDILGICIAHGDTEGRGKIGSKMLYETGFKNIPIHLGKHTPEVVGKDTAPAEKSAQFIWAEDFDLIQPQTKSAPDFIIETLRKYPEEVILFTVGPLDNIEDVIDKAPGVLKKAKKVVSMFGSIDIGYGSGEISAEWNVWANIGAAKKLMNSGANIVLAPLDITGHVILDRDYVAAVSMRQTPLTDAISALYALWYKATDWATHAIMYDGVAIGMVLWPELFETKKSFVYVDDEGFTRVDETKEANCEIGTGIKTDEFLLKMSRRIISQNFKRP